ncbi:ShlB/FhaC/HecB family hemolysin secretion/activation protein [Massilia aerilata]|uniref:ShlB/FhaC/HecB family hemolysin secretion/activation protein n=1 Tax=Massilia aerilata TaxID=453817 RepID=A0ABW0RVH5_9BURK
MAQQQKIPVTSVHIEGNTLLPEPALAKMTADLPGTERSLAELNAVAVRVQDAYRNAGYGGVVAYVPPQENPDGKVVVRVVEGRLAQVRVSGNSWFDSANVRAGLPSLREGATPRVRDIDRDIQSTNDNPAKHVRVTLMAGARPGEIDADVGVTDSKPLQYLIGFNNTGTSATGTQRLSAGIQHANLFGLDHVGTFQYQTSPQHTDRVRIYSLGYRVPLYAQALSIDAFYAHSTVSNGTTATTAGPLSFTGKGTVLGLRLNRNLDRIGEYDHHLTFGIDRRVYDDDCSVGVFGSLGCGPAAVDVSTLPLSLAYSGQKQSPALAYGISAALSANAGGSSDATFEAARPGAKRHYVIARVVGFAEKALPAGFSINGRVEFQYSPHALISGEKFGLGGVGSVRGYAERELAGDNGYLLRFELAPAALEPKEGWRLRPYLFLDHGRAMNHGDMPCRDATETSCALTGAGIGARLNIGRKAGFSLDVGRASTRGVGTTSGDVHAHFALNLVL